MLELLSQRMPRHVVKARRSLSFLIVMIQFYSCGSRKMATGVKEKLLKMIQEGGGFTDEEAQAAFERVKGRYSTDIFE